MATECPVFLFTVFDFSIYGCLRCNWNWKGHMFLSSACNFLFLQFIITLLLVLALIMDDICDNVNYISSPRALSYVRDSKQGKKVLKHMNKVLRNLSKLGIKSSDVPRKGVMVGNVGHGTGLQEAELLRACLPFGAVQAVVMVPGMAYCFVVFADLAGAERAYSALHGRRNPVSPDLPVLYLAYVDSVPGCDSVCKFDLKPPGLLLYEDFVTDAEEESLLNCVDWTNTSCHSGKVLKQRRVKHYGYEFRYDTNNVDKDCPLPEGIPPECDFLWPRLRQRGCDVGAQPPDQLTVNHYEPGHGIPQHVDTHSAFEDPIMSLSLGASVVMDFKHLDGRHAAVVLPRRSLLVMSGEARLAWSHGITARKTDVMPSAGGGLVVQDRSARTSFTFRRVRHGECRCEHRDRCDSHQRRSTAALEAAGTDEMAAGLESQHVHEVYEKIADHFSETRHKPWPNVLAFVQALPPGAVLLDVGCGNAKYFARNTKVFQVGCDTSTGLARVCRERGFEVLTANCLQLPFRSGFADCCISIAVIHHLASQARRLRAVREMVRVLRPGGRALLYVWSKDQQRGMQRSAYLKQASCVGDVETKTVKDETPRDALLPLPVHTNRTQFKHQDVFVPWIMKPSGTTCVQTPPTFYRYYHVFEEGELEQLCSLVSNCTVTSSYYDQGNWCVILQKTPA
ncbi:alkylated DNA repair protein alkB homolog 8 [Bacillus rossius redtenbacheri]|uniref:alkylated DNA repair protein alkB homolog 8 n=1 Tax=Bacillus rossius redtenbacheri TaxID=93214 RepID=UPI002FDC7C62